MTRSLDIPVAECFEPLLAPMRYKGAWGGRGSGKSHTFADLLVDNCVARPGLRAICIREVQKSLKDSVKFLLESKINEHEVGHLFKIRKDDIVTPGGGLIVFIGLQDHTAESLKSFEGFDVAYVEEAQSITARSLELMRPTVRKPGSELWFSWNPRHASDPVDMLFRGPNPPPDSVVIQVAVLSVGSDFATARWDTVPGAGEYFISLESAAGAVGRFPFRVYQKDASFNVEPGEWPPDPITTWPDVEKEGWLPVTD